jgi:crotonobetainyl-CoA:carnitine CoA-transferase CaiB-like acyl-CoA transferase
MAQYYWTDGKVPERLGSGHQSVVPYQAFKTSDIYVVVAIFVDRFWKGFCEALELPELIADPRFETNAKRSDNRADLIPILEKRFLEKTGNEWLAILKKVNVPGAGKVKTLGNALKSEGVTDTFTPPEKLGESTDAICRDLLGYTDDEIKTLHEGGIV